MSPTCTSTHFGGKHEDASLSFLTIAVRIFLQTKSFYSYFESSLGSWHVKGLEEKHGHNYVYLVVTATEYSLVVAAECLDDLSETFQKTLLQENPGRWKFIPTLDDVANHIPSVFRFGRGRGMGDNQNDCAPCISPSDQCCEWIAETYGLPLEEENLPTQLYSQIGEEYAQTAEKMQNLFRQVDETKDKLHQNILLALNNTEKAEDLHKVADDLVLQAAVFKKRAKKLKWRIRREQYSPLAAVLTIGFIAGFLAGGPGGAAVFTELTSVAAAQALEAGAGALIMGTGYLGASSAMSRWTFKQKFLIL